MNKQDSIDLIWHYCNVAAAQNRQFVKDREMYGSLFLSYADLKRIRQILPERSGVLQFPTDDLFALLDDWIDKGVVQPQQIVVVLDEIDIGVEVYKAEQVHITKYMTDEEYNQRRGEVFDHPRPDGVTWMALRFYPRRHFFRGWRGQEVAPQNSALLEAHFILTERQTMYKF